MKNTWYYLSFLIICSCNCDNGNINTTETTGYEVTFPDGKKNGVSKPGTAAPAASTKRPDNPSLNQGSPENANLLNDKQDYQDDLGVVPPKNPQKSTTGSLTALNNSLPVACELVDVKWLEKIMDAKEDILTTLSSPKKNPNVSSCFFRWDNGILPNCGVFVQIMENPVPEEVSDYAHYFIKGKLENGEVDMTGSTYKFEKYNTVGTPGAYSSEQGKFFWQVGPERLFMMAFNTGLSKSTERKHADAIARHVMVNYEKFLGLEKK